MNQQLNEYVYRGVNRLIPSLINGQRYLVLGFLGMDDWIVFVQNNGTIARIPFDEEEWDKI